MLVYHFGDNLDIALAYDDTLNLLLATIGCRVLRRPWIRSLWAYLGHQACLWMEEFMRKHLAWLWSFLWIVTEHLLHESYCIRRCSRDHILEWNSSMVRHCVELTVGQAFCIRPIVMRWLTQNLGDLLKLVHFR